MAITINGSGTLSGVTAGLTGASMPSGSVLQVKSTTKTDYESQSLATDTWWLYSDSSLRATLTPTASNSIILLSAQLTIGEASGQWYAFKFMKDGTTDITDVIGDAASNRDRVTGCIDKSTHDDNNRTINLQAVTTAGDTNERYYNILPKGAKISKKQDDLEPIFSTKPAPTPKDYLRGYFYRYFTKRKNSPTQYYEINEEMFKSLNKKEGKYDHNLYHPQKITWDLSDNAKKNNSITIKKLKSSKGVGNYPYSQIQLLFGDMEEYKLSNEVLNQTTTPEKINTPKPKLPLQRRKKVKEAQEGAIDLIKEKTRKRNKITPSKNITNLKGRERDYTPRDSFSSGTSGY